MKSMMLAGLLILGTAPMAMGAERTAEAQAAQAVEADREAPPRICDQARAQAVREALRPRGLTGRRRSGRQIPDAELIGPRGAL
jgi:hypothetical protein